MTDSTNIKTFSPPAETPAGLPSYKDSPEVKRLLDVICQIIAEEYCKTALEHPELFSAKG